MRVDTLPTTDPRWAEFSSTSPDATPFHLPAWISVIADCYGFDAFVLAILDTDGEILGGVPTIAVRSALGAVKWVSLPFSDVCPMLMREGVSATDAIAALREHVLDGQVRELEIRSDLPPLDGVFPVNVGYRHALALPDDPAALRPNKGHRYSRNRAVRSGIKVVRGFSAHDVDTFFRLHTLTRRRHGVPVQPRRLFDLIWKRLIEPRHGFVSTALLDGEVLAAGLYLGHNGTLVAKYHASDPTHPDMGAGYLIDWDTMVEGCNEGFHTLDMGRSDPDAAGLRLYKSSWGAQETPLVYTHVSRRAPQRGSLTVGEIPKRIIQRSPLWVCRALGEALYRFSA